MKMPQIHPIRWRNDGYGTQVIDLGCHSAYYDNYPLQRGCVKIWKDGRVVDRALTVKAARRRIERLKAAT